MRLYRLLSFISIGVFLLSIASCKQQQELSYFADAQRDSAAEILHTYNHTICPGDQLYIYVSSATPESVIPFNTETNRIVQSLASTQGSSQQSKGTGIPVNSGYFVDDYGFIDFPVLGRLQIAGISIDSLGQLIEHKLISEGYVNDPIVTTRMMNFRVTLIGEVAKPGQIHPQGDRITIFEALAMAGDITIYGQREKVGILREANGQQIISEVDLTSKEIFDSPYYYLKQNDIIYIEPNEKKKKSAVRNPNIPSYISLGGSAVRIATTIWYRYYIKRVQDRIK